MNAFALHCPNCGAAADPDARRCLYCRARLATVSCPSCFALMFDGASFCPKCGGRRARSEADDGGARCPACASEMRHVSVGTAALLECAACDGVWLDAEQFEGLCADTQARAAVLHRSSERPPMPPSATVRYRPCLRCAKMMNRVNFGRMSATIVDVCRGHGTFLDAGELHAIIRFIEGGGLDRARQHEKDELETERQRLAMRQAQLDAHQFRGIQDEPRAGLADALLAMRRLLRRE